MNKLFILTFGKLCYFLFLKGLIKSNNLFYCKTNDNYRIYYQQAINVSGGAYLQVHYSTLHRTNRLLPTTSVPKARVSLRSNAASVFTRQLSVTAHGAQVKLSRYKSKGLLLFSAGFALGRCINAT